AAALPGGGGERRHVPVRNALQHRLDATRLADGQWRQATAPRIDTGAIDQIEQEIADAGCKILWGMSGEGGGPNIGFSTSPIGEPSCRSPKTSAVPSPPLIKIARWWRQSRWAAKDGLSAHWFRACSAIRARSCSRMARRC